MPYIVPDDERRDQVRILVGRRGHLVSLILFPDSPGEESQVLPGFLSSSPQQETYGALGPAVCRGVDELGSEPVGR
jgi:hypothetical protein